MKNKFLECRNCGASLTFDSSFISMKCSFCDSLHLIEFDEPEDYKLLLEKAEIILFDIKKNDADDIFRKWVNKGLFLSGDFKKKVKLSKLEGVYIPFFKFRISASSSWNGRDRSYSKPESRGPFLYRQMKSEIRNDSNLVIDWRTSSPSTVSYFKKIGLVGNHYQDSDIEMEDGSEIWLANVDDMRYRIDVDNDSAELDMSTQKELN